MEKELTPDKVNLEIGKEYAWCKEPYTGLCTGGVSRDKSGRIVFTADREDAFICVCKKPRPRRTAMGVTKTLNFTLCRRAVGSSSGP